MNIEHYSALALRTMSHLESPHLDLAHMALGIAGEAGEVADIIKKSVAYGKPLDRNHVVEELGDVIWYMNGLLSMLGASWDEVLDKNIAKLEARYPDIKFDAGRAINRDLDKEAAAAKMG